MLTFKCVSIWWLIFVQLKFLTSAYLRWWKGGWLIDGWTAIRGGRLGVSHFWFSSKRVVETWGGQNNLKTCCRGHEKSVHFFWRGLKNSFICWLRLFTLSVSDGSSKCVTIFALCAEAWPFSPIHFMILLFKTVRRGKSTDNKILNLFMKSD